MARAPSRSKRASARAPTSASARPSTHPKYLPATVPAPMPMQLRELLLQSLEHEIGGTLVYATALECAVDAGLREEWEKYHAQTLRHVEVLTTACLALALDPDEVTPGRAIVHHNGKALVTAMKMALANGNREAAQLVACECVVLAETKDHFDWELIGECAKRLPADAGGVLKAAYDEIEGEEDEHLYHSKGWCRELWLKSLGLPAVLPPPEDKREVKTAAQAAAVERERKA